MLSIAVCDHYNHVNHIRQLASDDERAAADVEYAKGNVILLGADRRRQDVPRQARGPN